MQAQDRLVTRSTGSTVSVTVLVVVLAVAMLAVMLIAAALHNARPVTAGSHSVVVSAAPHEQAPDARERNDIYSAALASRSIQSPDAHDRNVQLSYRQLLSIFNDHSPDAQERNIELSGR